MAVKKLGEMVQGKELWFVYYIKKIMLTIIEGYAKDNQ